jgi:hypothetical protein
MQYIALSAVVSALRERRLWSFVAALATSTPEAFGPNLRLLPDLQPQLR